MKFLILMGMALAFANSAIGQRRASPYWSVGGYGNIIFPGTGHAPGQAAGCTTVPYYHDGSRAAEPHSAPGATAILPPAFPYDTGYADEHPGSDSSVNTDPANPAPQTVLDLRDASGGGGNSTDCCATANSDRIEPRAVNEGKPTIYLIAFKDHRVVQALGYWMESRVLHYVSTEYGLNQATADLIDWNLSQRLNAERGVQFKLPK